MPFRTITRREAAAATTGLWMAGVPSAEGAGAPVRTSRLPGGAIQPQAAYDESGILHLVYFTGEPKSGELFYTRSADHGANWAPAIPVNTSGSAIATGTIRGAQMALGRNGRVHVAWNGSGKALPRGLLNPGSGKPGEPMLYARLNDRGTAFEPQRNLMTRSFGLDGGGSVAAGAAGNVYVTWHGIGVQDVKGELYGEARRQVWIAISLDDGKSFSQEKQAWLQPAGACRCCGMKAFAGRPGGVSILYRSARESVHRDIYLLRSNDSGGTFTGVLLHKWEINACPMSSMDLVSGGGRAIAAWETGGQVYWAGAAGRMDGKNAPIPAPGEGKGRKHPRLAVNRKGETLFVWTEGTGWQRGGALAWQHYDESGRPTRLNGRLPGVPAWSFAAPVAHPDGCFTVFY